MKTVYMLLIAFVVGGYALAEDAQVAPASQPVVAAPAPAVPEGVDVGMIVKLFKEKRWRPAVALLITLLIFLWRRYAKSWALKKIPAKHVPWVVALVGLAAALPTALTADPFVWWRFLLDGFIISGEAVLLWSTVGKQVLPKLFGSLSK